MSFPLTEEQHMVQLMVREFARKEIEPVAARNDVESRFPTAIIDKMGGLGLMGMMVPAEYGGGGTTAVSYVLALQEIAYACAATAVTMSVNNLVCGPLLEYGTEEQKEKYLIPLASGETLGSFAITEPEAGSDAASVSTRAVLKGNKYIINGSKVFITNGGHAGTFIVIARLGDKPRHRGMSAFIVERGTPGFEIGPEEKKMGVRASSTVSLVFDDCAVPAENMLGGEGEGFKIAMTALDSGRIGISSQAIGIARAAFDEAIKYGSMRKQFGRALVRNQAIQWMIADAARDIEAAHLLALSAAMAKDRGESFTRQASISKLFSSEAAVRICYDALQIHGGYGYTKDFKVERLYRDARVTTIYEGTSEVQRIVIANNALK